MSEEHDRVGGVERRAEDPADVERAQVHQDRPGRVQPSQQRLSASRQGWTVFWSATPCVSPPPRPPIFPIILF
jgi:hypothetical protein